MIKLFIVEDDPVYSQLLEMALKNDEYDISVFNTGEEFLDNLYQNPDIITLDYNLHELKGTDILKKIMEHNKDTSVILVSGQPSAEVVVEAYKLGAKNYIIKDQHTIPELKNAVKNLSEKHFMRKEIERLQDQVIDRNKYESIDGESPAILKVIKLLQKVEKSNILTLITGESGCGKEVVAQTIHYNSDRKRKPFVAINVAAIPEDLIESELFGHEKGAFTGANTRRKGKFEEANEGTIFLDEIGDMDLNLQTKLLRVIQENEITRLGGNKVIKLNTRIVCATNKNLAQCVKDGTFREDLYYRIQGFLVHLPPLRERGNDVILLANSFIEEYYKKNKMPEKKLSNQTVQKLMEHSWPGNVRELRAVIERAMLISDLETIEPDDIIFSAAL